jgi:hypothetical protein
MCSYDTSTELSHISRQFQEKILPKVQKILSDILRRFPQLSTGCNYKIKVAVSSYRLSSYSSFIITRYARANNLHVEAMKYLINKT